MTTWGELKHQNQRTFAGSFECIHGRAPDPDNKAEEFYYRIGQGVTCAFEAMLSPPNFGFFAAGATLETFEAFRLWKQASSDWPIAEVPVEFAYVNRLSAAQAAIDLMLQWVGIVSPTADSTEVDSAFVQQALERFQSSGFPVQQRTELLRLRDEMQNRLYLEYKAVSKSDTKSDTPKKDKKKTKPPPCNEHSRYRLLSKIQSGKWRLPDENHCRGLCSRYRNGHCRVHHASHQRQSRTLERRHKDDIKTTRKTARKKNSPHTPERCTRTHSGVFSCPSKTQK